MLGVFKLVPMPASTATLNAQAIRPSVEARNSFRHCSLGTRYYLAPHSR